MCLDFVKCKHRTAFLGLQSGLDHPILCSLLCRERKACMTVQFGLDCLCFCTLTTDSLDAHAGVDLPVYTDCASLHKALNYNSSMVSI